MRALLGEAKMCRKVECELSKVEEGHPWHKPMRDFMEPRAYGEFTVILNDEIPPDRVVFVDNNGDVIATVMLEQQ